MKRERLAWMGWVVAAGLAGIMFGSGFQAPSLKVGVVDLNDVIEKSDLGKQNKQMFEAMKLSRESLLEFIDQYRVLNMEQATKLRDLMLKTGRTKTEDAEIERIKAEVIVQSKRSQELATKMNLTPEERTLIEDYARRSQTMNDLSTRWLREFANEVQTWVNDQKQLSYDQARAAVKEVSTKEAFTVVFEGSVALFGANDISKPTLDVMNAKK
jgi:plasmid maintenance system antidote protein VapI